MEAVNSSPMYTSDIIVFFLFFFFSHFSGFKHMTLHLTTIGYKILMTNNNNNKLFLIVVLSQEMIMFHARSMIIWLDHQLFYCKDDIFVFYEAIVILVIF